MNYPSHDVRDTIEALGTELLQYTDQLPANESGVYADLPQNDIEDACHRLFALANVVATSPNGNSSAPSFELTQKALSMGVEPDLLPQSVSPNGSCFQPELRIVRALARHGNVKPVENRLPSAVLFDLNDEPFAYQNADGYPTAYSWRSARVQTNAGARLIPSGAIFEPVYGEKQSKATGVYQKDPRHLYRGAGLIALKSQASLLDEVELKRVSLEFAPDDIRAAAMSFAIYDIGGLKPYEDRAKTLTMQTVEGRVAQLLRNGHVLSV